MDGTLLTDATALRELYGTPSDGAIAKEIDYLHPHYRAMIAASPFMVMATCGPEGLDVSPRGDPAGFVVVEDERTL
ncbi:MAG TPA: pyridoxamine 5'-phosphate oxidase family protein, partial [Ktedonobacterales bacterium]|nr:pyridoxamine 5'-phosphate oxidase family protein [Ktedonobacterales bacterium]